MMRSVRIFNANTLFRISLAIIVMVAAIYMIGFFIGSAAGKSADDNGTVTEEVAEENDNVANSTLSIMCCIIGFSSAIAINGTAINLYYKVDGCKYARTIKHGSEKFCKSLAGSVLISSVTAIIAPLVLGIFTLTTDKLELRSLLPMALFSLGASLLSGIMIRPLISTKSANVRTFLLIASIVIAMFILGLVTTAVSYISYTATLITSIAMTAIGAVGAAASTASACRYIKENWQF